MEKRRVQETVTFEGSIFDVASRLIKNVCLLSPVSKNGYRYKTEAMAKATPLYDGVQVYISHPTIEEMKTGRRDVMKLAGKMTSPRFENGKIRGDIETLPDEFGKKFFDISKTMPESVGCSHVADLDLIREGGELLVESIKQVHSVDLVASPATNKNLFESHATKKRKTSKYNENEAYNIGTGQIDLEDRANEAYNFLASATSEGIDEDGAHEIVMAGK